MPCAPISFACTRFVFRPRILHDLRHYRRSDLSADLLSGLVVGIVALPLAIAFAIAASPGGDVQHTIGPGVGILTAIVAGVVISALGGSRVQIGGPTGAFIVIIYGVVERFGLSGLLVARSWPVSSWCCLGCSAWAA